MSGRFLRLYFFMFCRIDENSAKERKESIFLVEKRVEDDDEDIDDDGDDDDDHNKIQTDGGGKDTRSRSCSCSPAREAMFPDSDIQQVSFIPTTRETFAPSSK